MISQADPDLVALHCQEIGGKDFEIQMPKVTEFVRYTVCVQLHTLHMIDRTLLVNGYCYFICGSVNSFECTPLITHAVLFLFSSK